MSKQLGAAALALAVASISNAAGNLDRAEGSYQRSDFASTLEILLPASPKTPAINALIGKSYYMDGQYKNASLYLEKAAAAEPSDSNYADWLGRAYGRRAEQASFLTALPLAVKTRESFERAVALDATNREALGDLFEFYLAAPAVIGGGMDKAEAVAARIARLSLAESHYVRARIAEKRKNPQEAESEYRQAVNAAPGDAGRLIDLADFLSRNGRYEESDRVFEQARLAQPDSAKVIFARAAAYVHSRRNLPEAQSLLRQYANLPHTPDDPPQSEVARLARTLR